MEEKVDRNLQMTLSNEHIKQISNKINYLHDLICVNVQVDRCFDESASDLGCESWFFDVVLDWSFVLS